MWRLSSEAGGYVAWADGGRTLTWALGPTFHRLPLACRHRVRGGAAPQGRGEGEGRGRRRQGETDEAKKDEAELQLPTAEKIAIALVAAPRRPQGSFVLKGARVVTMNGDEVLEGADVVVTGNRIAAVGRHRTRDRSRRARTSSTPRARR